MDVSERGAPDVWGSFQHDPRDPAVAALRAADADREVVQRILVDAFADGRLDRAEYDERSTAALGARTLGELPPLVLDLVPERPVLSPRSLLAASPADLHARGVAKWREARADAFRGMVALAVLTWTIYLVTSFFAGDLYFPWPLIVNAVTLIGWWKTWTGRDEIIEREVHRLEKKQARQLRARDHRRPDTP